MKFVIFYDFERIRRGWTKWVVLIDNSNGEKYGIPIRYDDIIGLKAKYNGRFIYDSIQDGDGKWTFLGVLKTIVFDPLIVREFNTCWNFDTFNDCRIYIGEFFSIVMNYFKKGKTNK